MLLWVISAIMIMNGNGSIHEQKVQAISAYLILYPMVLHAKKLPVLPPWKYELLEARCANSQKNSLLGPPASIAPSLTKVTCEQYQKHTY